MAILFFQENNLTSILDSILQNDTIWEVSLTVFGAIFGALISYVLIKYDSTRSIIRKTSFKLQKSKWTAVWLMPKTLGENTTKEDWCEINVETRVKGGKLKIKSTDHKKRPEWNAELTYFDTGYFTGSWRNSKSNQSGSITIEQIDEFRISGRYSIKANNSKPHYLPICLIKDTHSSTKNITIQNLKRSFKIPHYNLQSESKIRLENKEMNLYHQTEINDELVWKYHSLKFTQTSSGRVIVSTLNTVNSVGESLTYNVEGAYIGDHLILSFHRNGAREEPAVAMYPFYRTRLGIVSGVLFGTSMDGNNFVSKTLFLKDKVKADSKNSESLSAEEIELLENNWTTSRIERESITALKIVSGTTRIYEAVTSELANRKDTGTKKFTIEILGYTLFSVTPHLQNWLDNGFLDNTHFNFFCLNSEFIKSSPSLNDSWSKEVNLHIEKLSSFFQELDKKQPERNISYSLHDYKRIPGIHGFNMNNRKYFVSFSTWNGKNQIAEPVQDRFFLINVRENTPEGKILVELFENWKNSILNSNA